MKVLTWNVNRAGESRRGLWEFLRREQPDIVLLQEVAGIPARVLDGYHSHRVAPRYFDGRRAPFSTAILSRGALDATPYLGSELPWVERIHRERRGWIIECRSVLPSGESIRVVSVHSPAFPIPESELAGVDVAGIQLTNNPKVWFTEILWALLRSTGVSADTHWIVAGDFNSSVKFDDPYDRGNRQIIERLNALGLTDCLSYFHSRAVPTFQHSGKSVIHQLDYCYVSSPLLSRLARADVPGQDEVFRTQPRLSDHLPIVCEFDGVSSDPDRPGDA